MSETFSGTSDEDAKNILLNKKIKGIDDNEEKEAPKSLGKVNVSADKENSVKESINLSAQVGWKNIPVAELPSMGYFYECEKVEIAIKAAEVGEIRHFSTIDESDALDINDKMNYVIDKCLRIKFDDRFVSPKDLKEADRFYLIFAIKELTFIKGENDLFLNFKCSNKNCRHDEKMKLERNIFSFYKPEEKLMEHYDSVSKSFRIQTKRSGMIQLFVPSIGAMDRIKTWILNKREKEEKLDEAFITILPFMIYDWRSLDNKKLDAMQLESLTWDMYLFSAYSTWAQRIVFGTKTSVTTNCKKCGEEVTTPISFQRGFKSIFVLSDID